MDQNTGMIVDALHHIKSAFATIITPYLAQGVFAMLSETRPSFSPPSVNCRPFLGLVKRM